MIASAAERVALITSATKRTTILAALPSRSGADDHRFLRADEGQLQSLLPVFALDDRVMEDLEYLGSDQAFQPVGVSIGISRQNYLVGIGGACQKRAVVEISVDLANGVECGRQERRALLGPCPVARLPPHPARLCLEAAAGLGPRH